MRCTGVVKAEKTNLCFPRQNRGYGLVHVIAGIVDVFACFLITLSVPDILLEMILF